ncbi:trihelix transcription factor GTL1-like isoform X2 [Nymphaea colorata]|uniref:trihelix transcription factor GTL1-like isoform X2 n=1 Tax=Nymphaea colorata TaxID=210225 RepID=UPI00129D3D26|nr:trihelix transcription factor GTL1-like isoform X2 [Nymphaea colorata]
MQQGGSPYEVTQYGGGAAGGRGHMMGISGGHDISTSQHQHSEQQQQPLAEAASPISSRPPARSANFEELVPVGAGGGFPDDEALAGEEAERGAGGNRWPRQETLALLKIRSEMDAAFRDATLKGPLWEDVSRKLAELGYNRSSKKCKEKFENVHKYYKRTKEGRAGRQDGKNYRFFKQLEALHGSTSGTSNAISTSTTTPVAVTTVAAPPPPAAASTIHSPTVVASGVMGSATRMQTQPSSATTAAAPSQPSRPTIPGPPILTRIPTDLSREISLSSGGSSTSGDSSEEIQEQSHRKRKRSSESSTRKMMNFFEGLMKQVVEKQVALQQKFLETIEKREEDRMIREEAWKRQEMARLNKELDVLAQERAMSASRDAAMIAFLQKFTGQTIHLPPPPQPPPPQQLAPAVSTAPVVTIPAVQPPHKQHHHNQHHQPQPPPPPPQQQQQVEIRPMPSSSTDIVAHEQEPCSGGFETASSRWPKVEVLALINLRSGLESRYQEAGPKGPLWEEISAEMGKMGYKRSAKRCKEKWENINKYYKKVKESNKKRPEDSKTCPYFPQLDALYRKKILGGNSSKPDLESPREPSLPPEHHTGGDILAIMPTPISAAPPEKEGGDGENGRGGDGGSAMQGQKGKNNSNNGAGFYSGAVEEGNGVGAKKHQAVMDMDDPDSDNVEADDDEERDDEDDDDEEDDDREPSTRIPAAYEAQYPRQGAPTSTGNAGSFITMVQ